MLMQLRTCFHMKIYINLQTNRELDLHINYFKMSAVSGLYAKIIWAVSSEKSAFDHAQNVQIYIILNMRKVSSGSFSAFIHFPVSSDSISRQ